ncbi:MAG TPA: 50S ribosomal protein L35 [Candidatus Latescibacteria bacterium]|jgi:large subunit ribosomal protein L35|nr:50S ribosomal protein L35 [Gemmatimonadota bacterium]MDP6981488.1 50S ribosomal protein L35 [Candidatus Latescibacterota bacterium]MBU07715.1 50S ribosomal protein L35 [Gemmatimonadota bacterium]MDP7364640.1 50S ribosomal protein L35 [Candidatus Latescibacterota bacterium]MDP7633333.1 50S ribosomal protein L35 [Candidatus Latescibacterota bacterium]|tara:strand:- start:1447 stop:1644 length:198 start_codon:yes stop_codon:yes gene_type:complete
MPKLKTHKSSAKRIKQRGNKSLKRGRAFGDHFLGKRSTKRKRQLRKSHEVSSANMKNVRRSLGLK